MVIGRIGAPLAKGATRGADRTAFGPLVLGGLLVLAVAAVALVLARRRKRSGEQPDSAGSPAGTAAPEGTIERRDGAPAEGDRPARLPDPSSESSSGSTPGGGPVSRTSAPEASTGGGVEERVRARVEEDPRTGDITSLSVEADGGMVWIDGVAPSQEAKQALTEVVGDVEGVNIVVNRVTVGGR